MSKSPPSPRDLRHLNPRNYIAALHLVFSIATIGGSILLTNNAQNPFFYIISQLILAFAFLHAFIMLHEAGHHTLFKQVWINVVVGHLAGFVALIPYASWRPIHNRHHRFTGWQDLDATTATLASRDIANWEKGTINTAWRLWLPLFSILYRLQNYWHIPRLMLFLEKSERPAILYFNAIILLFSYSILLAWIGIVELMVVIGPALFLSLMAQDVILLSQHTHMPTNQSGGNRVQPFSPIEQVSFTRSMRLPSWFSLLIMHFDAHELHHMYPAVPGYLLRCISYTPPNEINWIIWIRTVKSLSGTAFLFGKREDTGVDI